MNTRDNIFTEEKITKYTFRGQSSYGFIPGMKACTSVAMAFANHFLAMENNEFFKSFLPSSQHTKAACQTKAEEELGKVVKEGVDLNKRVSKGENFLTKRYNQFSQKHVKEVQEAYELPLKLGEEFLIFPDQVEKIGETNIGDYSGIHMKDLRSKLNEHKNKAFIATTGGHTTVFFAKENPINHQTYYISINSGKFPFRDVGEMEIHKSVDTLVQNLNKQWGLNNKLSVGLKQVSVAVVESTEALNPIENPLLRADKDKIEKLNEKKETLYELIKNILSMPEWYTQAIFSTIPTGIKEARNAIGYIPTSASRDSVSSLNAVTDSNINSIKTIFNKRLAKKGSQKSFSKDFYSTVLNCDTNDIKSIKDTITTLIQIRDRLARNSNKHDYEPRRSNKKR